MIYSQNDSIYDHFLDNENESFLLNFHRIPHLF